MKIYSSAAFLLLFFCFVANAQQSISTKVSGKVLDASTQKPVEYATITATDIHTEKIVNGAVANTTGNFEITGLPFGTYTITIEFIGYQKKKLDSIVLSSSKRMGALGTITLALSSQAIKGVTITADAPLVENKIDKVIYNVASDITSQGGVALDVLKKVPQVMVDIDGNVELQGDANIRFLINGKPSSLFGNSVADALASIPASQIKAIEVITSPGAKYDAQGTGGIINIILKDNKLQGVNGNLNLSAGTRLENGSFNLNIRHNNFGVNMYVSGNGQISSHTPNSQNRLSSDTAAKTTTTLLQNGYTDFVRSGYQAGMSFDWNVTKKDDITGSFGYNYFSTHSSGFISQEELTQDASNNPLSDVYTSRISDNRFHTNSIDWSLNYIKKFKKDGQELDVSTYSSDGTPNSSYTQYQTYLGQSIPFTGSASSNPGTNNQTNISIDYTQPINDKVIVETGAKATFQNINSTTDVSVFNPSTSEYTVDPTQSYSLKYAMKVYAGYASVSFPLFHYLDVKAGARYEYTDVNIDFPNTSIPSYGTFVPSFVLSHKIDKNQFVKFTYSHRIERPEYWNLNPYVNLSDPYNLTTGNPLLHPEIGDNFELGYNKSFDKGANFYIGLIERINTHDIKQITTYYPTYKVGDSVYNNVSVANFQNVGVEYNSGVSFSGSLPIKNKLSLRSNIIFLQREIVTNGTVINGSRVRATLNATYQLPHNFVVEVFGNYNSATNNIQGRQPEWISYTFAFRKQFWDKNASFGFTTTDPFNKYINQVTTIVTSDYNSYNVRDVPYRSFGISLTYKFGKLEFKKNKEDDNNFMNNPPANNG